MVGGYCATETLPAGPYEELDYNGRRYRAKRYDENRTKIIAGINAFGFFFHPDDLQRFFLDEGCDMHIVSDEPQEKTAGRYVRLLATKREG